MKFPRLYVRHGGFTLVEILVSVAVFAVASGIILGVISTAGVLGAKNLALNDSGDSLRRATSRVCNSLEEAVEITDVCTYDVTAQSFSTTVDASGWGNAVRFMRFLPGTFFMIDTTKSYTMSAPPDAYSPQYITSPANTITAKYNRTAPGSIPSVSIAGNERLFVQFPVMRENGKLGLGLQSASDNAGQVTFTLDAPIPATVPASITNNYQGIRAYNAAYLIIESAFVLVQRPSGYAELLYIADTANPAVAISLTTSVDPRAQVDTRNANAAVPAGCPFWLGTDNAVQYVRMMLPLRARSLDQAVRRLGGSNADSNAYVSINIKSKGQQRFTTH